MCAGSLQDDCHRHSLPCSGTLLAIRRTEARTGESGREPEIDNSERSVRSAPGSL